jgi:hypothetical protein
MAAKRRLRAFRLSDVPEPIRLRAKESLLKTVGGSTDGMIVVSVNFSERLAIGIAAERPSERVYWISEAAWARESKKATWRKAK